MGPKRGHFGGIRKSAILDLFYSFCPSKVGPKMDPKSKKWNFGNLPR